MSLFCRLTSLTFLLTTPLQTQLSTPSDRFCYTVVKNSELSLAESGSRDQQKTQEDLMCPGNVNDTEF